MIGFQSKSSNGILETSSFVFATAMLFHPKQFYYFYANQLTNSDF